MEAYIDDMLVISKSREYHIDHLRGPFQLMRLHRLHLNPDKCAFRVGSGNFLGFLVSQSGIEMALKQVKAIEQMQPPIAKKQIQTLTRKSATLNKFIFIYSDLRPFFTTLKGASTNGWGPKCDKDFHSIKEYIASPLFLSQPADGEKLYLYLTASATAVSAALVRSDVDNKQKPIYFVIKMLIDAKIRYTDFERIVLALRMAAKKIRPYFQGHTIFVLTSYSIRDILHKPDASGRFLKWVVELSEFDIEYLPRSAVKG